MATNLITGGAGFIGSHLAEHLLDQGEEVVVLDNLSTGRFANMGHLVGRRGFSYLLADLSERSVLEEAVGKASRIYHLAAAVGVRLIVDDPVHTIETNVDGTAKVLRLAARRGIPILITSTSEVYGKGSKTLFREEDDTVYGPTSRSRWSYAFSKAVDEFLALAYHESMGLPAVVVRLFNTVGPRQIGHYGMVIPRFVSQALAGGPITVYGDGEQSRCFCHVRDIVPALYRLMQTEASFGQVVNLGNDAECKVNELAQLVRKKVGEDCEVKHISYEEAYRPGFEDLRRRVPCLEKAQRLIGYQPRISLDEILDDVIADQRKERTAATA